MARLGVGLFLIGVVVSNAGCESENTSTSGQSGGNGGNAGSRTSSSSTGSASGGGGSGGSAGGMQTGDGIASMFPGDMGIDGHPDVLFADDFESYSQPSDLEQRYDAVYQMNEIQIA